MRRADTVSVLRTRYDKCGIVSVVSTYRILQCLALHCAELIFLGFAKQMTTTAQTATVAATATATATQAFVDTCMKSLLEALRKRNMIQSWTRLTLMPGASADSVRFQWQSWGKHCCFVAKANGTFMLETADNSTVACKRWRSLLLKAEAALNPDEAVLLSSDSDSDSDSDNDSDGDVDMDNGGAAAVEPCIVVRFQQDWLQYGAFYYQYERNPTFYGALRPAPAMFPCMDYYDNQERCGQAYENFIDRHNLEMGNCVLHMMRNGQPVLTLKRVVKRGCVMLGLFAARNLGAGSVIGLYLGPVVAKGQKCHPLAEDNGLDQDFIVRHFDTFVSGNVQEDEILPKGEPVAPAKNTAFHLMHFINSCDPEVAEFGETKNCDLCPGVGKVCLTKHVLKGEEIVTTYGTDYWKDPVAPKAAVSNQYDCDSDYTE